MRILLTGAAGFIGFHLAKKLLSIQKDVEIVGVDNLNPYYDVNLKIARIEQIKHYPNFKFLKLDLKDTMEVFNLFKEKEFDFILHMAAQPGVRYSLENPYVYIDSNIYALVNLLEATRNNSVSHFVFASSSSVYGANKKIPFSTKDNVDHPISLYAATKKSGELICHTYSALYNIPITSLRFFTVYGPWGRPDMAPFIFVKNILEEKPINVYNFGKTKRDFTYIDDLVECVLRIMYKPPKPSSNWNPLQPDPSSSFAPYKIYNVGNSTPVEINEFIKIIENYVGKKAKVNLLPMQPGDVEETYADTSELEKEISFKPSTPIEVGIKNFIDWYRGFYKI